MAKFFRALVLTVAVRNGDGHRKNFGVIYDDAAGEVTLAPTFDVITTTAYLPPDGLALTLDGTKRWPDAERLERFGIRRCELTPAAAQAIIAEVADAVAAVTKELPIISELDANANDTAKRMQAAWAEGVASLGRSAKDTRHHSRQ
jgi:serine/threonine-protein kinase HipA